jgi:hypothetical protein
MEKLARQLDKEKSFDSIKKITIVYGTERANAPIALQRSQQ